MTGDRRRPRRGGPVSTRRLSPPRGWDDPGLPTGVLPEIRRLVAARGFDRAEGEDWILFFDEADAFFGKRTDVADAHHRYADPEMSWLLQRIEAFGGIVVLATNSRREPDDPSTRRRRHVVEFPPPSS